MPLLVERRPLENQESGGLVSLGILAFWRSTGFRRNFFLFSEHVECVQVKQAVTSLTAAAGSSEASQQQAGNREQSLSIDYWKGVPK